INDYYRPLVQAVELATRSAHFSTACVREKLAWAWSYLCDMGRAIGQLRAALAMEDAVVSLNSLEQLANLESRYGARLLASGDAKQRASGEKYMKAGLDRLKLLLRMGVTVERQSLLGSYWKRRAQAVQASPPAAGRKPAKTRGKPLDHCLAEMREAYWRAAEESHQRAGGWDYYPLFNALDADVLLAARGDD